MQAWRASPAWLAALRGARESDQDARQRAVARPAGLGVPRVAAERRSHPGVPAERPGGQPRPGPRARRDAVAEPWVPADSRPGSRAEPAEAEPREPGQADGAGRRGAASGSWSSAWRT